MASAPPAYNSMKAINKDLVIHCQAGHDLHIGLSWDFFDGMEALDLDAQCILLDDWGRVMDAVYYNKLYAMNGALTHSGDERTGETEGEDESIDVDLDALPPKVHFIVVVVSCHDKGTFSQVETASLQLKDGQKILYSMGLGMQSNATSVMPGYAYRDGNVWRWHERIMNSTTGRNFQECEEQVKDLLGDVCPALLDCPKLSYDKIFPMKKGDVVAIMTDALTFRLGLGWEAEGNIDLDASCLLLDENKTILDTVYYGKLKSQGVIHSGDNLTGDGDGDDELITVHLTGLNQNVACIVFTVNMFSAGKTFKRDVYDAYIRMMCGNPLKVVAQYPLSPDEGGDVSGQCLVFARMYCTKNGWKFEAVGNEASGQNATSPQTRQAVQALDIPSEAIRCGQWTPNRNHVQADSRVNWLKLRLPPPSIVAGRENSGGNRLLPVKKKKECLVM